jgi:hypothetical protein
MQFLPPTKGTKIARALGYLFVSIIGFSVLLMFPFQSSAMQGLQARGGGFGVFLAVTWAVFMATSIAAVPLTLLERYRAEYIILPLHGSALAVALVAAWLRFDPLAVPRTAAATALLMFMAARFFELRRTVRYAEDQKKWKTATWTPQHGRS